ncbi:FAD-binding oxidoreductase [Buchnera aphidicola (Taiwanaphis decaspermi)]|uniref:FAD-binding oxidoreductase n=1 Tax=Buchnera aphidicola TaxID=9 RepID=UPI0031B8443D
MNNWVKAKVISIKKYNGNLLKIILHADILPFIAGQFTKFLIKKKNSIKIRRAYSYVNSPKSNNLEFYIVKIKKGVMTSKLFKLNIGDDLIISKKSFGFFILKNIPKSYYLWMFATGTGIGPYLSMLQDKNHTLKFNNIILVHAVKYFKELCYLDLMYDLKKKYKGKLIIKNVLSREYNSETLTGRIPNLIKNKLLENSLNISMNKNNSHVMLCGNPNMVKNTEKVLIKYKNMKKHLNRNPGHITKENYW